MLRLAKPGQEDPTTSIIVVPKFFDFRRSKNCSDKATTNLFKMIVNTAPVIRDGLDQELPIDELAGDLVKLVRRYPADVILVRIARLFSFNSQVLDWEKWMQFWKLFLNKATNQKCKSLLEAESWHSWGQISRKWQSYGSSGCISSWWSYWANSLNTYDEPTSFWTWKWTAFLPLDPLDASSWFRLCFANGLTGWIT